jgi:type IV pilus assembly protein PilY1
VKEENELDPDMGYSFGDAFIARSYITRTETYNESDHPWVVIFSNGYQSKNGQAVLYVLDALSGDLIRKISTGPSGNNGLSSPALIDVDNDDRVDFVYAGDLLGNLWKFDLRDPEPENWGVIYGTDVINPIKADKDNKPVARIDYNDVDSNGDHDTPKPLINVGRPITTAPDVAYHCEEDGYMVIFGTGKFLGENDVKDNSQQGIFGVWDFGDNPDDYLGDWQDSDNSFSAPGRSDFSSAELLEQIVVDWGEYYGSYLRTLSDYEPEWLSDHCNNGQDDDGDGLIDESDEVCGTHVGWFFDLPYHLGLDGLDNDGDGDIDEDDEADTLAGERVVKDLMIRHGNAIVLSLIPGDSPCSGGGNTIVHEMPFCSGGRLDMAYLDTNEDGKISSPEDYIEIEIDDPDNPGKKINIKVPPNGKMGTGILHKPVVVGDPTAERELKIFSSSSGATQTMWEKKEEIGFYYWKEH